MNWRGHAGLNLTVLSVIGLLFDIYGINYYVIMVISTALSSLPDIDLRMEISHRKYTHNIFFALVLSVMFGYVTYYVIHDFYLGFSVMFTSLVIHIVGDLMTYKPFNPLAPLVRGAYSFKLFKSSSKVVNNALIFLGSLMYFVYTMQMVRLYMR